MDTRTDSRNDMRPSAGQPWLVGVLIGCVLLASLCAAVMVRSLVADSQRPASAPAGQHCVLMADSSGQFPTTAAPSACTYPSIFAAEAEAMSVGGEVGTVYTEIGFNGASLTFASYGGQRCSDTFSYSVPALAPGYTQAVSSLTTSVVLGCGTLVAWPSANHHGAARTITPDWNVGDLAQVAPDADNMIASLRWSLS